MQGHISLLTLSLSLSLTATIVIAIEIGLGPGIGIGIGIGGGGGGPPTSPSSNCPLTVSDFESPEIYQAYLVIQQFKATLDPNSDPMCAIPTWNGPHVCNNGLKGESNVGYKGFYCEVAPDNCITPTTTDSRRSLASVDFNGFRFKGKDNGQLLMDNLVPKLPKLALFHANSNNFTHSIPDLSNLPFFYELDVSNNKHTGGFPLNVLKLVNLSFLDLRFNIFCGTVPPKVFNIQTQVLFLNNNQFTGPIPSNLGSSPANYMTFANNYFTGPIPRSIGQAANTLLEILFLNNQLSGCLPYEIGLLRKATVFDAGLNRLTGPIPMSFGCLEKIEQLNLGGNLLYGEVPDNLCMLCKYGRLQNLTLSNNYFTKLGMSCYGLIKSNILHVDNNCIPGLPKQRPPWECAEFVKKPKPWCPNVNHIPCWSRKYKEDVLSSKAKETMTDGGGDRSVSRGSYTTYTALHVNGHH